MEVQTRATQKGNIKERQALAIEARWWAHTPLTLFSAPPCHIARQETNATHIPIVAPLPPTQTHKGSRTRQAFPMEGYPGT